MTTSTNAEKALNKITPPVAVGINKLGIIGKQSSSGNQAGCQIKEPLRSCYSVMND